VVNAAVLSQVAYIFRTGNIDSRYSPICSTLYMGNHAEIKRKNPKGLRRIEKCRYRLTSSSTFGWGPQKVEDGNDDGRSF
jgi:hypothetical protein